MIQDIRELTSYIFPKLVEVFNKHYNSSNFLTFNVSQLYYYILCELMETIYCCSVDGHNYRSTEYRTAYDLVKNEFNKDAVNLERAFCFYVKVPPLYGHDNEVSVSIVNSGFDLVITYCWKNSDILVTDKFLH